MPALHGAFCPACGSETLAIAAPGTGVPGLVCYNTRCPRPEAAAEILADRQIHHVVTFTETGFTIRHPLIERLDDAPVTCDLNRVRGNMSGPPGVGRYEVQRRVVKGETEGVWYFEELPEPAAGAAT